MQAAACSGLSFLFPKRCHVILVARTMPSPIRSVDVSGGFQGLGGVFPDAPSIRCFPQVIQSGSVSPLLEPVIRHIVDCRADLDAKSRPAGKKSRRSKGSGDSPTSGASARCAKCFRFDIHVPDAVTCRRERRRAVQGTKNFLGTFPNPRGRSPDAGSTTCRTGQKPGMFQARNIICAGAGFSDAKTRFSAVSPPNRYFTIHPRFASRDFFSNNAFTGQRH